MFQVFGEKNEYSPPGEWAKVLSEARPQVVNIQFILFPEDHFAGVGDGIALAGLDVDGGVAVVEDLDGVLIDVLVVLQFDVYQARSVRLLCLMIAADAFGEVEALASAVGHIVSTPEIGQVRDEGVIAHLDGVAVRYVPGIAIHRVHAVDVDFVVSLRECRLHLQGLFCCPRSTLFGCGASAQRHQC